MPQPLISNSDSVGHLVFARQSQFPLIFWDGYQDDNWDIYCRYFIADSSTWGTEFRITTDPANEINPVVTRGGVTRAVNSGEIYGGAEIVWQSNRSGNWDIYSAGLDINSTLEVWTVDTVIVDTINTTFPVSTLIIEGDVWFTIVVFESDQLGYTSLWLDQIPELWGRSPVDTVAPSQLFSIASPVVEDMSNIHYWFGWEHQNDSGHWEIWGMDWISIMGAVEPEHTPLPKAITLTQNYPNPFNGQTIIPITLSRDVEVAVAVYNLRGQLVKTLHSGLLAAGEQTLRWDGTNEHGNACQSGVYFIRVNSRYEQYTRKVILLK